MVNALPICTGKITRVQHTKNGLLESVIDFFVVCDKILPLVTSMTIDESGSRSLTKYRGGIVKSDHRMLEIKVNLMFHKDKMHERDIVFNVRNKICQNRFLNFTSEKSMFTRCFDNNYEGIEVQFNRWQRLFTKALFSCFRKVRITEDKQKPLSKIDSLMNEKKKLMKDKHLSEVQQERVEEIDDAISEACSEKELEKLKEAIGELEVGGGTNNTNVWKQMRKAFPKKSKPLPTGIKNEEGKVITNPTEKKRVTQRHFLHRLRKRSVVNDVKDIRELNENVFLDRLKLARKNSSPEFTDIELDKVLKNLKTGKSKDHNGYITELFKHGVIGTDLKKSILMMMNKVKSDLKVPKCLRIAQITILHKKKCRLDLNNWRGVFVCSVLRTILMKLIYERTYSKVDQTMTDAQIGARRKKSVRNHIFILNSIISDVTGSVNKESVDLNVMDYKQMFDSEDLVTVLNAMYEAEVTYDMFALMYEANETTYFKIKTPNGVTEIEEMKNKILQGDVLAPMLSSNMVYKNIGLEALK